MISFTVHVDSQASLYCGNVEKVYSQEKVTKRQIVKEKERKVSRDRSACIA